jgi:hypothetical protein
MATRKTAEERRKAQKKQNKNKNSAATRAAATVLVGASKAVKAIKGTSSTTSRTRNSKAPRPNERGITMRNKPGKVEGYRRKASEALDNAKRDAQGKAEKARKSVVNAANSAKKNVQSKVEGVRKSRAAAAADKKRFSGGPLRSAGNKVADPRKTAQGAVPKKPKPKSYSQGKAPLNSARNNRTTLEKAGMSAKNAKRRVTAAARGTAYDVSKTAKSAKKGVMSAWQRAKSKASTSAQKGTIRRIELKAGAAASGLASKAAKYGAKTGKTGSRLTNKLGSMALTGATVKAKRYEMTPARKRALAAAQKASADKSRGKKKTYKA